MNCSAKLAVILAVIWTYTETYPSAHAQTLDYAFIADTNTPIPGGTGNFTSLPTPGISNGAVIFNGHGTGGQEGIYFFQNAQLDVLVNQDTPIPNGTGRFTAFNSPTLDPDFNVAFRAEGQSAQIGIYTHIDGTVSALADIFTDVPGTGGAEQFTDFSAPWIYNGEVAFRGIGSGGTDGIYTNKGGSLRVVADTSTNIPNGTGTFTDFGVYALGRPFSAPDIEGDIVFYGSGTSGQRGIYAEVKGALIRVADNQTINPSTRVPFTGFNTNFALAANIHSGDIVFVGGQDTQRGMYKYSQGTISTIVDRNTVNPDTGGTLRNFGGTQGYGFDSGDVSFLGSDSSSPNNIVFAVLDGQLVTVATPAELINGNAPVIGSVGTYGGGIEDGSVAFYTGLADFVAIQKHRWLGTGSAIYQGTGNGDLWEDPANWPFGLLPRDVVPTVIDPAGDVTIHGPHSDVTLTSLQIGGGNGIATLWMNEGATFTVNVANVTATGALAGNGTFSRNILNNGLIRPDNISARDIQNNAVIDLATHDSRLQATDDVINDGTISGEGTLLAVSLTNNGLVDVRQLLLGGACLDNFGELRLSRTGSLVNGADEIHNMGLIRGSGSFDSGVFENRVDGSIRIDSGERMDFQVDVANAGLMEVLEGELETFAGTFNSGNGLITGRDASFRFGTGLTNNAAFAISFGTSDVFGDVANNASGTIVATGNSNVTFYDDVTNDGTFQVSSGSTAVFLGDFNGANGIIGTGTVYMEGDLRPGNSPATVSFGGDLNFGALASLEVELGGTLAGNEYDSLDVAGALTLGGLLEVLLIDSGDGLFEPSVGDAFEIVTATGGINGSFNDHLLPTLTGNLEWLVNYEVNSLTLTVILPGDYDFDGDVDGSDFLKWQRGESPAPLSASDLAAWQSNYGTSVPLSAASTTVPEPSSLLLATLAGLLYRCRRQRN